MPTPCPPAARRLAALLTLAALPGLAAAQAAASSVTIYGLFDAATRRASNVDTIGSHRIAMEDGIMTGSRLGFRGREDLGDGMAAVFTMEAGFDPSNGLSLQGSPTADFGQVATATRWFGREIHVGLRNRCGGIHLGRNYTVAHAMAARFQPQGNPNSVAHSLFSSHHVARQDNMLRVDARIGKFELHAGYTFGEQTSGSTANSTWGLGVGYADGPLSLAAYVQQLRNLSGAEERRIFGFGGNYRFSPEFTLFGGYMQRSNQVSPQDNRVWTLGTNLALSKTTTLSLAHFSDKQTGSAALNGQREVSWATLTYAFSRRSDVYAIVDRNRVEGGYARPAFMGRLGTQTGVGFGVRTRF